MNKRLVVFAVVLAVFAVPSFVSAAALTQAQVSAIISLLQSFGADQSVIANVNASLGGTSSGVSPAWCHTFNTNLKFGDSGSEVQNLSNALTEEGLLDSSLSSQNVYGDTIASAVTGFQEKYRNTILTPSGLRYGTGYVGASTRAKLNALYGCGTPQPTPQPTPVPVTSFSASPTSGVAPLTVKFTGVGSSIKFGDGTPDMAIACAQFCTTSAGCAPCAIGTTSHTYIAAGTYTATSNGQSVTIVAGSSQPASGITVISPVGGEILTENSRVVDSMSSIDSSGQMFEIKWSGAPDSFTDVYGNTTGNPARIAAYLEQNTNGQFVTVGRIIPHANGSIIWIVGQVADTNCVETNNSANTCYSSERLASPGRYYVKIVDTQTGAIGRSAGYFTIVAANTQQIGSLTATKNPGYGDQQIAPNTANAKIGSFVLSAGATEGVTVKTINITMPASSASAITNLVLRDSTTGNAIGVVTAMPSSSNSFTANLDIPTASSKTVDIYANILASASGSIQTSVGTGTVGTGDSTGSSVSVASAIPLQNVTIQNVNTSLIASIGAGNASSRNILAGASNASVGQFSFAAQGAPYTIKNLAILIPSVVANSVTDVTLSYKDQSGTIRTVTQVPGIDMSGLYAKAVFSGLTMYVPANDSASLDVYIGTPTITSGATSGAPIGVQLDEGNDGTFRATYVASNNSVGTVTKVNDGSRLSTNSFFYVRKSIPTFAKIDLSNTIPATGSPLYKFTVTADPAGMIEWSKLTFNIQTTGGVAVSNVYLADDATGNALNDSPVAVSGGSAAINLLTNSSHPQYQQIAPGTTRTYALYGTVSGFTSGSSISISLAPDIGTPASNTSAASVSGNVIWSDRSTTNHSVNTPDWTNGALLQNLSGVQTYTKVAQTYPLAVSMQVLDPASNQYVSGPVTISSGSSVWLKGNITSGGSPVTAQCTLAKNGTYVSNITGSSFEKASPTITADTTFTLTCSNSSGSGSASVQVKVSAPAPTLNLAYDIDGNGVVDQQTDGKLINNFLVGFSGDILVTGSIGAGATRTSGDAVTAYLVALRNNGALDVDGNGQNDVMTDGILISRYMQGSTGTSLTNGAVASNATRTTATQIIDFLNSVAIPTNINQTASVFNAFSGLSGTGNIQAQSGFVYTWGRDLQVGSPYADDVTALQRALTLEGVYSGEITGGFYEQTYLAVKAFQAKYGIDTTGYVGPVTRAKLNALY